MRLILEILRYISVFNTLGLSWDVSRGFVDMMVADVLVPNKRQAISNHHTVSSETTYDDTSRNSYYASPWWRHHMETFSALLFLGAGNSPVSGEFPAERPVTRSCGVFFDLRLNKQLSKQSWGWWLETPWRSLWRHCNDAYNVTTINSVTHICVSKLATITWFR